MFDLKIHPGERWLLWTPTVPTPSPHISPHSCCSLKSSGKSSTVEVVFNSGSFVSCVILAASMSWIDSKPSLFLGLVTLGKIKGYAHCGPAGESGGWDTVSRFCGPAFPLAGVWYFWSHFVKTPQERRLQTCFRKWRDLGISILKVRGRILTGCTAMYPLV